MSVILDGKALSLEIRKDLAQKFANLKKKYNVSSYLAVVIVGNDPASQIYVRNKIKACEEIGIESLTVRMDEETTQQQLEEKIKSLVEDKNINGILVQLPLPKHLDGEKALNLIPPTKDVDGFSDENVGKMLLGKRSLVSCTPNGIIQLLKKYNIEISGKNAVVIGRSNIVGKPMAVLLTQNNATVTLCHSKTKNLEQFTKNADIVVVAIGKAKFLTEDMVKDGAVIVDVGMNRDNGILCGDVDFDSVSKKASYITPVPGGVGPMTITMLTYNTYFATCDQNGIKND